MTVLVAYKSNELVEASYKLTLQEQRLILACIGHLNPMAEGTVQDTITITAEEFFSYFPEVGRENAERELNRAIDRLWDRSIVIRKESKREEFRWIQYRAQYIRGKGEAVITFSAAIMPYLTQLKGQFTKIVLRNMSGLSRTYGIRIYELLQQFIKTGDRIIKVEDFRSMLAIGNKYATFRSFNQLLVKPAIEEINEKSNLKVRVTPIKQRKKVVALHFIFEENSTLEALN